MTRALFLLSGVLLIALAAASCKESKRTEQLKWLYTAISEETFRNDLKSNSLRFFVVYGYASEIPGVGEAQHKRCYPEIVLTPIEGTGDALESDEHLRLTRRAKDFALTYNILMREHLDRSRGTACP